MEQITEALKHQFAKNITLVAQEKSKLRKIVLEEAQETELIHFEELNTYEAKLKFKDDAGYHADGHNDQLEELAFRTPKLKRRQQVAQFYYWEAVLDRNDKINLITDPTSKFPQAAGAAIGRAQDRAIIRAVGARCQGGRDGTTSILFDVANNVVPLGLSNAAGDGVGFHNDDAAQSFQIEAGVAAPIGAADVVARYKAAGLTLEKLIMARQMLNKGTFNSDEKMYFVCSEQQLTDLLQDKRVTNADYNSVRALVNGEVKSFMGFEFIKTEMLTGIAPPRNLNDPVPIGSHSIRECIAFTENALRFGTVTGSKITRIEELQRYHYAPSLYHGESFGASRVNEQGVVIVKCLEKTQRDHVVLNGWVQPEAAANNPDQRTARLTRTSTVPANTLTTWLQGSFADDNALNGLIDANSQNLLLAIALRKL